MLAEAERLIGLHEAERDSRTGEGNWALSLGLLGTWFGVSKQAVGVAERKACTKLLSYAGQSGEFRPETFRRVRVKEENRKRVYVPISDEIKERMREGQRRSRASARIRDTGDV